MEAVMEEPAARSDELSSLPSVPLSSPVSRRKVHGGMAEPSSPLRAAFTADDVAEQDNHVQSADSTRSASGTATIRFPFSLHQHAGPPTAADFNLADTLKQIPPSSIAKQDADSSTGSLFSRRRNRPSGTSTPPDRRSVQFARDDENTSSATAPAALQPAFEPEGEDEDAARIRQGSFFARLKAMATPTHTRQASDYMSAGGYGPVTPPVVMTPGSDLAEPRYPASNQDGSEAEGDIEESSMDERDTAETRARQRQKRKRHVEPANSSGPSTPKAYRFPSFLHRDHSSAVPPSATHQERPGGYFPRSSTMNNIPEDSRMGVSEDEGRNRIAKSSWRRGLEGARGLSYAHKNRGSEQGTPENPRRPSHMRRFTGFAAFEGASSPFRAMKMDRQSSMGAQKWRQVKASLKMIGRQKKDERTKVDHQKSAELVAELLAGSPAAVLFASMYQRDENGRRKIPVLLEQLKISIPVSQTREDRTGTRHMVFSINLEYGNGTSRMTWTILRSLRDFTNLHAKYKFQSQTDRYNPLKENASTKAKMPRFPKSAFPYARGLRGLADEEEEEDTAIADASGPDGEASGTDRPRLAGRRTTRSSFGLGRRKSSTSHAGAEGISSDIALQAGMLTSANHPSVIKGRDPYTDRQRKKLEVYLQQMIRWLIFRPDSTRLCKFLELSALSMRMAAEGGYHGKEGLMIIVSRPSFDFRSRPTTSPALRQRRKPKWFMVKHSYIMCVDSLESLIPLDVFLVDSDFTTDKDSKKPFDEQSTKEKARTAGTNAQPKHHLLKLYNSERKLKMLARNERQLAQFKESIDIMQKNTIWSQKHRFDSFAPVRKNVFARWLVDGRDHMWQVSRAIDNARSFVYIHDWWLSPELYMRRPAAISQKWRLDRLLLRKAQEGVKIFVIVYRNIESAIPIESQYTKAALLDLHPNICVQRSPNQFRQNQFFWAHHEKLVVVDNAMAFVGGVDLCFGRWDDPSHALTDDKLTGFEVDMDVPRTAENCQVWPGKDYSNPRVQDFYNLTKPYEEMYDRTKVPRMPWHDIAMTLVGQPARDVARHFVQRWNFVLRQRVPSRPTPVLLPPPEYEQEELEKLGMTGTCQIQILRSCTTWSIGTPNKTECSIMNAYVYLIKHSEHFVYIENQFFITSCTVGGSPIVNKIGDALVERIELAYQRGDNWRACIVIPLMPGFQNSVDAQDGTSIRLIMQCQYRSICRGETSIFVRLRAKGIDPLKYIEFYSLRQWGKIGPRKCLTTEQLYIHAKCMVVDDRTAIIGSANINERSMLGSRDSEVAAVVTDQEMIPSSMGGKPYDVGTFPHTLRMRLMREHLGIDVDEIYRRERDADENGSMDDEMDHIYNRQNYAAPAPATTLPAQDLTEKNLAAGFHHQTTTEKKARAEKLKNWVHHVGTGNMDGEAGDDKPPKHPSDRPHDLDVAGYGFDNMKQLDEKGNPDARDTYVNAKSREVLFSPVAIDQTALPKQSGPSAGEGFRHHVHGHGHEPDTARVLPPVIPRMNTRELGLTQLSQLPALPVTDDTDIGGPPLTREWSSGNAHIINPLISSMTRPMVEEDSMKDPLVDSFYKNIWHAVAENNTKLYRQVFRCMPDSEVQSWRDYREFNAYNEKFMQSQGLGSSKPKVPKDAPGHSGPPGSGGTDAVMSSAAGLAGKAGVGGKSPSSKISGLAGKLFGRNRSNTTDTTPEMTEKEKSRLDQPSRASESPTTGGDEYDEKAAERRAGVDSANDTQPVEQNGGGGIMSKLRTITLPDDINDAPETTATQTNNTSSGGLRHSTSKRRRRGDTKSSGRPFFSQEVLEKDEAEDLLKLTQGVLVVFPYDWLEREEKGGNWLYNIDQIAPLEIYD